MQLGVIGLGTMGANIARNAARNGAKVPVYNRTTETMTKFVKEHGEEGDFVACKDYGELIAALDAPRAVLIMVKAGPAVDAVIADLLPHLEKGDILIDGGNSHYGDTGRRFTELKEQGIHFIGMGVSGGEEGALNGPSMMPGADLDAYRVLEPLLTKMAAEDGAGDTCVAYIGEGGAGHFVKMVHNGIEYAVMQLLAESYDMLKTVGGFSAKQLQETYAAWNDAEFLDSFLVEITAKIFEKEEGSGLLLDVIKDAAGQKGTGKWTTDAAMTYGVAVPTINAAVDARIISGSAELREDAKRLPQSLDEHDPVPPPEKLRSLVRAALKQSIISAYLQGFELIERASEEEGWNLNLSEIARIWRGGCIIRSTLLPILQSVYSEHPGDAQAASEVLFSRFDDERQLDWRRVVTLGISRGIPLPAMTSALSYYDALRKESLPQNLIQAQRDFFGAHGFERTDKKGSFHADWL